MKKAIYMPTLFICTLLSHNASAEMYKWLDKNGETHYTQLPPPPEATGKNIEEDIRTSSGKPADKTNTPALPATKTTDPAPTPAANDNKTDEEKAKASEEEHRSFCQSQKVALQQLKTNSLVKWRDEKGEHFLTADEKTGKLKQLQNNIETMCSPAMFSSKNGAATE